ncbi:hypothetical protein GCK32_011532 [Trichostrongylus colubriformis]|uniref:Major sperm protein n=1 Tax=Trichostrongylus colubriformis TaxID=6319 RepID=A0AAN8ET77_TRICO
MIPSKSVTFYPNDQRQQTYLVIQNESNVRIMFKMKSTRPTLYKMRPVFGIVHPGEKFSVRLIYKGIKIGNRIPLNDRFTVVVATNVDQPTEAGWAKASKEEPAAMRKRTLEILYTGVNDKVRGVSAEALGRKPAVRTKESIKVESAEVEVKRPKPVTKESLKVESQFAIKAGSREDSKEKVPSKVSKKVPKKVEVPSKEEVKVVDSAKPEYWMEVQDHERVWMKKLQDREDRWMQTAEEEPQAKSMLTAMMPGLDEMKAKSLIKQEQRTYLDGYYEGYKAGLVERQGAKEGEAVESALAKPSLKEDTAKNRAYKIGFIEGYNRAKLLRRTWKEKSVMKALEPLAAKETRQPVPLAVSDGRNVTAKTPGGGSPILVDPLQKRDIVHITRTGKAPQMQQEFSETPAALTWILVRISAPYGEGQVGQFVFYVLPALMADDLAYNDVMA